MRLLASCLSLVASGFALGADAVNLVPNGDLSLADKDHADAPAHWDRPDGLGVQWLADPAGGKAIRMDTRRTEQEMVAQWKKVGNEKYDVPHPAADAIAATYGLSLYSEAIPIEPDRAYRLTFDCRGEGSGIKVWVRGYGEVRKDADHPREHRRMWEVFVNGSAQGAGPDGPTGWRTVTQDVYPTTHTPKVSEVKIMLFAYWPPGEYWFRRIRLEPLPPEAKP